MFPSTDRWVCGTGAARREGGGERDVRRRLRPEEGAGRG